MHAFLSHKLVESNKEYGFWKRRLSGIIGCVDGLVRFLRQKYKCLKKGGNNGFNQKDSSNGSKS